MLAQPHAHRVQLGHRVRALPELAGRAPVLPPGRRQARRHRRAARPSAARRRPRPAAAACCRGHRRRPPSPPPGPPQPARRAPSALARARSRRRRLRPRPANPLPARPWPRPFPPAGALTARSARTRRRSPRAPPPGGASGEGRGLGAARLPAPSAHVGRGCFPRRRPPRPRRDRLLPGSCVGFCVHGCLEVSVVAGPARKHRAGRKLRGDSPVRESGAGREPPQRWGSPPAPLALARGLQVARASVRSHQGQRLRAFLSCGCSHTS